MVLVYCQSITAAAEQIVGKLEGAAVFQYSKDRVQKETKLLTLTLSRGAALNFSALLLSGLEIFPQPVAVSNTDHLNVTTFGDANQDLEITYQLMMKNFNLEMKFSVFHSWHI